MNKEKQEQVTEEIVDTIATAVRDRIEEIFDLADKDTPGFGNGPGINWANLSEIRWQICGALAGDLEHGLGDYVEQLLEDCLDDAEKT